MNLKVQVKQYIRRHQLILPGDTVLVGLSGGADSVGLLLLLHALREELGFSLRAVHVNHMIRGEEARRDEVFSQELCERLQVPCGVFREDVPAMAKEKGLSLEEAGRDARRAIFRRETVTIGQGSGQVRIALAHHMDDQAETVLLNLSRGSGVRGLGAMEPCSGDIIRPLLGIRREAIRQYLREMGQDWCEDSTNEDTEITRNRIRSRILPELENGVNARTVEHLAVMAEQARELDSWLDAEAQGWICREVSFGSTEGEMTFRAEFLRRLPVPLRRRVLQELICRAAGHSRDITARHLEAVEALAVNERGGMLDLPYHLQAVRTGGELRICRLPGSGVTDGSTFLQPLMEAADTEGISVPIPEREGTECVMQLCSAGGTTCTVRTILRTPMPGDKIPRKEYTKWFDYDKIKDTLRIRTRRPDDALAVGGVGHKSLRRFMIDAHIPADVRERVPLLTDGDGILWVIGWRMSAEYQVTESTRRILEVTCEVN